MPNVHRSSLCALGLLLATLCKLAAAAEVLDRKLGKSDPSDETLWYDIVHLELEGKGWSETESVYDRLPRKAKGVVRQPVWDLSHNSAGICARFVTDAETIRVRWSLKSERVTRPYLPATGQSGLDLYVKDEAGVWRWLAIGQATQFPVNSVTLVKDVSEQMRQYLLYLPLYNSVEFVEVGIPRGRTISKAGPWSPERRKPIVFYGTSITQGAYASRPGMVHTALVGRQMNYPVINLGFAGNGKMEPEMASLLAELDPAIYVLDCLANLFPTEVTERVEPFVKELRRMRPTTPVLLVENESYPASFLLKPLREQMIETRRALHIAYNRLVAEGFEELYYLSGEHLLGDDGEGTVDGTHPSDLGFTRLAAALRQALEPILKKKQ